jgi:serine/threonine-protein kinase
MVGGRYRLDEPVATGGVGEVWRGTDTVLGRAVAVKMLRAGRSVDPESQARFRNEARTMAALRHAGVADVFDYCETADAEQAYLVLRHVDGQPLDQRIAEAGRLGTAETMSIVGQAARALHAVHQAGVVHRDVKPGNLIVEPDGAVVLVDFGVARSAESTTLTSADEVVGTPLYIAPEQVSKQAIGPATDIYALGAVAYHCLAGHPPFLADNPIALAMHHLHEDPPPLPADVPPDAREMVATAMHKKPAGRYPDAAAMAAAADAIAGTSAQPPLTEQSATPVATGRPRVRRRRAAVALAVVAALAVAAALTLALRSGPSLPPTAPLAPTGSAGATQGIAPGTNGTGPSGPAATGSVPAAGPAGTGAPGGPTAGNSPPRAPTPGPSAPGSAPAASLNGSAR